MRPRVNQVRLSRFLRELGRRVRRPVRFYLVGGSMMIDLGLRAATLDIDYIAEADDPRALSELEETVRALMADSAAGEGIVGSGARSALLYCLAEGPHSWTLTESI